MALPQKSKADYYQALSGKETTDDWDILVSYSENELNNLLDKIWGEKKFFYNRTFPGAKETIGNITIEHTFNLSLTSPRLSFDSMNDGGPKVKLTMGFAGEMIATATIPGGEPQESTTEIPEGWADLVLKVPLTSFNITNGDVENAQNIIHFGDTGDSDHCVIFHFQNMESQWDFVPHPGIDPSVEEQLNQAGNNITGWFKTIDNVGMIDYGLAKINSKTDPTSKLLRPKSYKIVSSKGLLNIFIQTEGGSPYPGNDQNTQFGRRYSGFNFSSIPQDYTACIIISRELFSRKFLLNQVGKQSSAIDVVDKTKSISDSTPGAVMDVKYAKSVIVPAKSYYIPPIHFYIERCDIDWNEHPLRLTLSDEPPYTEPKYKWDWDFSARTQYWANEIPTGLTVLAKVEGSKRRFAWVKNYSINFDLCLTGSDQPETWTEPAHPGAEITPQASLPKFSIPLEELNFFATQNILAPGEKFISASGLMFPGDLVLIGTIPTN
ncbi:uncharacterized protein BO88DRAFT_481750 [Aspergillus vadensis CBS 113365]|uniref:Uncharacterized protein n=1 Tax=Aspergillus vadensis (strain CBS 113365 / IMI 142717 / IBT 24658) TaxID=1448311 RepID=A0A319CP29_ASPVC|nr:hypothetical protein BO88DRAFT_481750 [Aspergillus vadensis CBS 113365]PYH70132.1 hypothetical protein BO88DRAFT_481750 [Aspergillus vadensis CBS 113365]